MPVVVERSQLVACKLYTARDEGSHKHGISDSERETIIHDILKFLPKSLSFQMASVAPKRIVVPGVSASLFASTSSSELEDAAAAAGVSTSSELFKSMKRAISGMMGMLGSANSRLQTQPESMFTYQHELGCKFSVPARTLNIDGSESTPIQHSFLEDDSLLVDSIAIDPATFKIYKAPLLQYVSPSISRGSLSISYLAKGSESVDNYKKALNIPIKVVVHFVTKIDLGHNTKSTHSTTIRSVVRETMLNNKRHETQTENKDFNPDANSTEYDITTWHITIETPILKDFFLELSYPNICPQKRHRLLCAEENAAQERTPLKLHQILLPWELLRNSLDSFHVKHIVEQEPQQVVEKFNDEDSNPESFSKVAMDMLKSLMSPPSVWMRSNTDNTSAIYPTFETAEKPQNPSSNKNFDAEIKSVLREMRELFIDKERWDQDILNEMFSEDENLTDDYARYFIDHKTYEESNSPDGESTFPYSQSFGLIAENDLNDEKPTNASSEAEIHLDIAMEDEWVQ
ncbi:hypothetical protein DI09_13p20 [Mitosporidium daphniae]|uniref:Uncharacterized protein n=1 Tax=Mitosporidium daphniae TaxID=1485682 RepID=A0A098VUA3_9MICR|nr:uncharacterized protein DI09_13p20 [Mitosporidium daphniae]KGG52713.1 hypothetical protein DI09_13p20 [Mitosporidium daphniae]|eukprot:XP_013239178.1 uncharacterized protein DI09_13p20 [Mitosporidium daphniae]